MCGWGSSNIDSEKRKGAKVVLEAVILLTCFDTDKELLKREVLRNYSTECSTLKYLIQHVGDTLIVHGV